MAEFAEAERREIPPMIGEQPTVKRGTSLIPIAAVMVCAITLFSFNPVQFGFYPTCQFYHVTGLLCPGCGSLRAWHQLLHGHLLAALHFNPLAVLALPIGVWWLTRKMLTAVPTWSFARKPVWLWTGASLLILFSILRNLPIGRTLWLAP